ncbi:Ig-like domain-containing protein [Pseudomonas nitroreducens]|nr:Ig-like domain-containing protein [Pseudomonas nitritireducens]
MMFDGAVAATAAEVAKPTDGQDAAAADKAGASSASKDNAAAHAATSDARSDAGHEAAAGSGRNVVFVDSRVEDAQQLLQGVAANTDVVFLDSRGNGVQQMAQYLAAHPGAASVQIIAHGNAGDLWLGNSYVSAENIADYGNSLSQLGASMQAGGDILIYACNTAQGERGQTFVNELASLTGRDIAASDDRTGNGSDWDLEVTTGAIQARPVLSATAEAAYQHNLAIITVTTTNDSGADLTFGANQAADLADGSGLSLREAINWAANGDTIKFAPGLSGGTIALTGHASGDSLLVIAKSLTIEGDIDGNGSADITLDGQYNGRVLEIKAGTVNLDGLIIQHGLLSGAGGDGGSAPGVAGSQGGDALGAGILVSGGTANISHSIIRYNVAAAGGGGSGSSQPQLTSYGGGGGAGFSNKGGGAGGGGYGNPGSPSTGNGVGTAGLGGPLGGKGGSTAGGLGGSYTGGAIGYNYYQGGAGGKASGILGSVGGGGGAGGYGLAGTTLAGKGGSAAGAMAIAAGATVNMTDTVILGNLAAGGGGSAGSSATAGTVGGDAAGAILVAGTLHYQKSSVSFFNNSGVAGGGGAGFSGTVADGASFSDSGKASASSGLIDSTYAPPPTATIVVSDNALKIGETSLVTFTFSRAVTGFTNADLTIANGTLSAVSSADGGITWTATFTPTNGITDTTNLITLDNTGVTAISDGVAGVGSTSSNNYAIDTQRPTATIVVADTALKIGETSQVTVTFSEAVSGFTNADLTIANGTLSAVSSADGGITWTATFTPTANLTNTSNLITLDNSGVVDLSGNAGSGSTDSNNYSIDTQRPTATIVVSDTALKVGETSQVTITFSEAVSGFTLADLIVANGTLSSLSSSDGGITWTATLTPSANITDTTNLISLDNTGVVDLAGNAGSGTTNSNNYAIDTARPTATIVVADNALKIGETSLVTITFSEAVTGFSNADLTIANGTLSAVSSIDGGITWTATFTPTANLTDATNVITLDNTGVTDAAGNTGSGTTDSNNYAVDTQRPTATIVVANPSLALGQTSLVTITFSEAVTGFTNADLTIANGTLSAVSSADGGITWTATFTPTSSITDATNVITLDNTGVSDTSGNAGSGTTDSNNYRIDTQRPTATIVMADPNLNAGETSLVTITFSEAVTGFTNADLTIPNGTLSAVSSSDGGITWTATFTPSTGINDATNLITLNNTGIADLAGNTGAGTTNSANFTINTVLPTATIVVTDSSLRIGETSQVTITFSEAVTGFTNADLTIGNGTLSAVSSADGGITWTATFTPTNGITDTSNLITLDNSGVQNFVGNAGSGTTSSNNYAIDTQRPTATIVVADTALGIGQATTVTITFSEAVTGFSLADLTVANGTLSGLTTSDNITWTVTLTPATGITDTSNLITLDNTGVSDAAGNTGSGSTDSNNYAIDSQRPTATIVMADTDLRPGETSLVTITFSEAVSGFDNSDLSVANGTLSNVVSSDGGITWTATFTPNLGVSDATNLIVLNNTGYTDLAGNSGSGTTNSANYAVQTLVPTATIVVADTALKAGETSLVTITFSEAVSGFDNSDLTVANGTLSNVSSSDGGITWTATLTPTANVTDASNLITLNNAGVSNASGNSGVGTTDSNNFAIDTALPTATIVVADNRLGIGETTAVTITFSEAVSGFDLSDISVANGVLSNLSSTDGGVTWTAILTPTAGISDATNLIVLDTSGVQDLAGNMGASIAISNNYIVDGIRPTASIVVADAGLGLGQTSQVTISFSEAVTGLDLSDLVASHGSLSNLTTSDGGRTWTATLTPDANTTQGGNQITLDTSLVADLAGNTGVGSVASNVYTVDTQRPTSSIVVTDSALNAGQSTQVTITFSEAVSNFDNSDLTVSNGTLSAVSSSDGGITWTATFTPSIGVTDASNLITLDNSGVNDALGNAGSGVSISNNYAIDTARPTATIVVADPRLAIGQSSLVTITFSEAVSGFDNADLSVANGSLSAVTSSDGGLTWTATFTPNAGVTSLDNVISLNNAGYTDAAGNSGTGTSVSNSFALDTQRPSATVVVANNELRLGQSSQVTITFSEPVSGLELSDLTATNATLSGLSSSDGGLTWTATLTPLLNVVGSNNVVTLNNLGYTDAAGNTGLGISQSNVYAINSIAQEGDPQYRTEQGVRPVVTNSGLPGNAPQVPSALQNAGPPTLGSIPLLDSSNRGSAQSALGSVFREGPSQSQLALIFSNNGNSAFGDDSGHGFLGFGGGDGGVFASTTLGSIFGEAREGDEQALSAFGQRHGDIGGGLSGVFAGNGLGQQLHEMNQREQRQVADLAQAFGELGQVRPAS